MNSGEDYNSLGISGIYQYVFRDLMLSHADNYCYSHSPA